MNKIRYLGFISVLYILLNTSQVSAQTFEENSIFYWLPQPSPLDKSTSMEVTSKGVIIGEMNTTFVIEKYNGVVVSNGILGIGDPQTNPWIKKGLQGRGISDLYYANESEENFQDLVFAAGYYSVNQEKGLYLSSDCGDTWRYLGNNFSSSNVIYSDGKIFLGSYSNGLWTSKDMGLTWEQKIGSEWYGPNIFDIALSGSTALTALENSVYISNNSGETWEKIPDLDAKSIKHLLVLNQYYAAASSGVNGLWISNDKGKNWENIPFFNNRAVTTMAEYENGIFISYHEGSLYKVAYYSPQTDTIKETGLNSYSRITDMDIVYKDINKILVLSENTLYIADIPEMVLPKNRVMDFPIASMTGPGSDLFMDKINSFFDHEYPLLAYTYHTEPPASASTTYNFMGIRDKIPNLYYSSHNGVDFDAYLGEEVLATDKGTAYYYYCSDCGNTIKINHANGLQSVYMHLRYDDLVIKSGSMAVEKGQKIGSVGMTGRTTGAT